MPPASSEAACRYLPTLYANKESDQAHLSSCNAPLVACRSPCHAFIASCVLQRITLGSLSLSCDASNESMSSMNRMPTSAMTTLVIACQRVTLWPLVSIIGTNARLTTNHVTGPALLSWQMPSRRSLKHPCQSMVSSCQRSC